VGVSRLFDFRTFQQLGISSRPGCNELNFQLKQLKHRLGPSVGIVEDDIYTGGTLRCMINRLRQNGVAVTSVIAGISAAKAINGIAVQSAVFYAPVSLLELTDPRDYLFGARHGGLVVAYHGQKLRVPYDAAFVDLATRSSLDPAHVDMFTQDMRAANYRLHQSIRTLDYPAALWYPEDVLRSLGLNPTCTLRTLLSTAYTPPKFPLLAP